MGIIDLPPPPPDADLAHRITKLNETIQKQIEMQQSWKIALRNGIAAGFGTVIGATLVVSVVLALIKPFQNIERIGPAIERLEETIKGPKKST